VTLTSAANSLVEHFWPEGLFIAGQVNVPEVFLFDEYPLNPDDNCFHQFDSVDATEDPPDDRLGRSVGEFIRDVESAAREGWEVFDPLEPLAQEFRVAYKQMFPD
jgi:hypothetical protein